MTEMTEQERQERFWRMVARCPKEIQEQIIEQQRLVARCKEQQRLKTEEARRYAEYDEKLKHQQRIEELPLDGISPLGRAVILKDRERRKRENSK